MILKQTNFNILIAMYKLDQLNENLFLTKFKSQVYRLIPEVKPKIRILQNDNDIETNTFFIKVSKCEDSDIFFNNVLYVILQSLVILKLLVALKLLMIVKDF